MALRSGRVGIHPSQVDPITGMLLNGPTPGSVSFEDLSDAQISNPEVGQTLQYNGTGWENVFGSTSPTTLSALQDVQITDPDDGDYLTYDSTSEKWINSGEAPAPIYTDLTVNMYGAVEDTISFTDAAGISHSEVFASGQSSKSVTFKINPSGSTSITFTSAVAKNPDDLTADYSKSVIITDATTEIKVMPDNNLYWYGYESSDLCDTTSANGYSWVGGSVGAPTHNTHDITCTTSSDTMKGIAVTDAINLSKIYVVVKGVTAVSGDYGLCYILTSKNISVPAINSSETITSASVTKITVNATAQGNYIPVIASYNGKSARIDALMYE